MFGATPPYDQLTLESIDSITGAAPQILDQDRSENV
jgi:hypothetical protein